MKWFSLLFLFSCANLKTLTYKSNHSVVEPDKYLATVYFLRGQNLSGINFVINDRTETNDTTVGILSSSSFFHVKLVPGKHFFSYSDAWKRNKPEFELKLEKSKIYYISMMAVKTGSYDTGPGTKVDVVGGQFVQVDGSMAKRVIPELLEIDLEANKGLFQKK